MSQKIIIKPLTEKDLNEGRFKYTKIKKAINAFLNVDSIEEMLPLIRHPKRVEPLLRDYYSRNNFNPRDFNDFAEFTQATLSGYPFWVTSIKKSDGNLVPMLIEQQEDEFLIDWETYVTYQPHDIESLVKTRPTGEFTIRCSVKPSQLNIYEYSDEKHWLSLALDIPDTDIQLRGYANLNKLYTKRLQWQQHQAKSHLLCDFKNSLPPRNQSQRQCRNRQF